MQTFLREVDVEHLSVQQKQIILQEVKRHGISEAPETTVVESLQAGPFRVVQVDSDWFIQKDRKTIGSALSYASAVAVIRWLKLAWRDLNEKE